MRAHARTAVLLTNELHCELHYGAPTYSVITLMLPQLWHTTTTHTSTTHTAATASATTALTANAAAVC
jgi:hypothetical protein